MKKRNVVALGIAVIMAFTFAACGKGASDAASSAASAAESKVEEAASAAEEAASSAASEAEEAVSEAASEVEEAAEEATDEAAGGNWEYKMVGEVPNVPIVHQDPEEPLTFAFIGFQNNPFWDLVQEGVTEATTFLGQHNVTIDNMNMGEAITAEVLNSGLEAALTKGVDGIVITPFVTGVENYIKEAVDSGVPVVTLAGESEATANETGRLCFIGQDNVDAGKAVAQAILDNTEPGKHAVITAQFTMENLELKRNTVQDVLDAEGYEFVGAYEAHDSADETFDLTQSILTANPDITAIYCVAGGNYGCPKAVAEAGMTGQVYVIGHDETSVNLEYTRKGEMDVVGQNPHGYAFDGFMYLYNKVVADQDPEQEVIASHSQLINKEVADELFPE